MGLSAKMTNESLEFYRGLIDNYQRMILNNDRMIKNWEISEKKKKGFLLLNEICKREIKQCQKEIRKLL